MTCTSPPNGCREVRLGRNGVDEVKAHAWFRNDSWTWDNIRQQVPPVVPELNGDMDTQYFDVIDDEKEKPESFSTPRVRCMVSSQTRLWKGSEEAIIFTSCVYI